MQVRAVGLFGFSECTQWSEVPAVWMGEYLTKEQCKDQFQASKTGRTSPSRSENQFLECGSGRFDATGRPRPRPFGRFGTRHAHLSGVCAGLYRGADRTPGRSHAAGRLFPMPQPMYSLRTNGTWIPKPEFLMYQIRRMSWISSSTCCAIW